MTRTVVVDRRSAGDDAWLAGDPAGWLPASARERGDRWTLQLQAGPVTQDVLCGVGKVWRDGRWASRRIDWEPVAAPHALLRPETLLPSMNAELRWTSDERAGLVLQIVGRYEPPGALPGRLLDDAGLNRVAVATLRHLLDGIAARAPGTTG